MFNEVIFVDFENFTEVTDKIRKTDAKVIVLVGLNQVNKSSLFAKELLDGVSSVELLKVKGEGKNALDNFIAYYLGVYIERNIKRNKELRYKICSNDKGYDPLIRHLVENGVVIERIETDKGKKVIGKKTEVKNDNKKIKGSGLFETDGDYRKVFDNLKNLKVKNRPGKLESFEKYLETVLNKKTEKKKIEKIINEFKNYKYIEVENGVMKYNM